jgi:hypothetical protein
MAKLIDEYLKTGKIEQLQKVTTILMRSE